MSRAEFNKKIYSIWAENFDVSSDKFQKVGSTVVPYDKLQDTHWVHLYHIGEQSILRCDPQLADMLTQSIPQRPTTVTLRDLETTLGKKTLKVDHTEYIHYLYPDDFEPYTISNFTIQHLTDADQPAVEILKSACTQYEYEDSWVSATDELATGAFDGDKLIACASMYMWNGFADPGVLIHPDYRRRGLGKATVSALCEWVLEQGRVMDYRCESSNVISATLAKSLGFKRYFRLDGFEILDDSSDSV